MQLPSLSDKSAILILRIVMGVIFISHGVARLYFYSIPGFGQFLDGNGFMGAGEAVAWAITLGEVAGGTLLVLGRFVRYAILFHALVITAGIFLVHLRQGWFVVGHSTGGAEYSVLVLAVLAVLYSQSER